MFRIHLPRDVSLSLGEWLVSESQESFVIVLAFESSWLFRDVGSTQPTTKCNFTKGRNPQHYRCESQKYYFNPLNAELNPICQLLVLLRAHPILHVSRIRVKYYSSVIIWVSQAFSFRRVSQLKCTHFSSVLCVVRIPFLPP